MIAIAVVIGIAATTLGGSGSGGAQFDGRISLGGRHGTIKLTPDEPGRNSVTISFARGSTLVQDVEVIATMTTMQMLPQTVALTGSGKTFHGKIELAMRGTWEFRISAQVENRTVVTAISGSIG